MLFKLQSGGGVQCLALGVIGNASNMLDTHLSTKLFKAGILSVHLYRWGRPLNMVSVMFSPDWWLHHKPRSSRQIMAWDMLVPALNSFVLKWTSNMLLAFPITPKAKVSEGGIVGDIHLPQLTMK